MLEKRITYYTKKVAEYAGISNSVKKDIRFNRLLKYKSILDKEIRKDRDNKDG